MIWLVLTVRKDEFIYLLFIIMNKQITTNAWLNSQKIVHVKKTY